MEDSQKKDLNLDAPLDVKSSDMLVPIDDEKFAHNRQRWQGHVLPTSLRYEHNGWAAGWYVYEFEFDEGYISDKDIALTRVNYNSNPSYIVKLRELKDGILGDNPMPTFKYNPKAYAWTRDVTNLSYTSESNSLSTLLHFTFDDYNMSATVTSPTGWADQGTFTTESSVPAVTIDVDKDTLNSDGRIKLVLTNTDKTVNINGKVTLPSPIYSDPLIAPEVAVLSDDILQTYTLAEFDKYTDSKGHYLSTVNDCYITDTGMIVNGSTTSAIFEDGHVYASYNKKFTVTTTTQFRYNRYNCILKNVVGSNATSNKIHSKASDDALNTFDVSGNGNYTAVTSDGIKSGNATVTFDIKLLATIKYKVDTLNAYKSQIIAHSTISQGNVSGFLTLATFVRTGDLYWANTTERWFSDSHHSYAPGDGFENGKFSGDSFTCTLKFRFACANTALAPLDSNIPVASDKTLLWLYNGNNRKVEEIKKDTTKYHLYAFCSAILYLKTLWIRSRRVNGSGLFLYLSEDMGSVISSNYYDLSRLSAEARAAIVSIASLDAYTLSNYLWLDFSYSDGTPVGGSDSFAPANMAINYNKHSDNPLSGGTEYIGWCMSELWSPSRDDIGGDVLHNSTYGTVLWGSDAAYTTTHIHTFRSESGSGSFDYSWMYDWSNNYEGDSRFHSVEVGNGNQYAQDRTGIAIAPVEPVSVSSPEGTLFTQQTPAVPYNNCIYLSEYSNSISGTPCVSNPSSNMYNYNDAEYTYVSWPYITHNVFNVELSSNKENIKDMLNSNSIIFTSVKNAWTDNYVFFEDAIFNVECNGVTYAYNELLNGSVTFNIYLTSKSGENCPNTLYYIPNTSSESILALPYAVGDDASLRNLTALNVPASVTGGNTNNISSGYNLTMAMQADFEAAYVVTSATTTLETDMYENDHWFFVNVLPSLTQQSRNQDNHKLDIPATFAWDIDGTNVKSETKDLWYKFKNATLEQIAVNNPAIDDEDIALRYNVATGETHLVHDDSVITSFNVSSSKTYFALNVEDVAAVDDDASIPEGQFKLRFNYTVPYKLYAIPLNLESDNWNIAYLNEGVLRITDSADNYMDMNVSSTTATLFYMQPSGIYLELPITDYSSLVTEQLEYKTAISNVYSFNYNRAVQAMIYFVPKAAYDVNGTIYSFAYTEEDDGLYWNINYDGTEYKYKVSDMDNVNTYLDLYSTDVREDTNNRKHIERIDCSKEKQLLKQFWDTDVTTENFWWIDSQTVMKLTHDEFIVYTKPGTEYDPWNGDKWTELKRYNKTNFVTSNNKRYLCTNAYGDNAIARLLTFEALDNSTIRMCIYNPKNNMDVTKYDIQVIKSNLNNKLVQKYEGTDTAYIYSYSDILIPAFLSEVKISATVVDGYLVLGLHYDNNLNQWAIWFDTDKTSLSNRTITGYGYVGVEGMLTGGEIPSKYFDVSRGGFIGTVNDLSILSTTKQTANTISQINTIKEQIVGNESQQWYISASLTGIVSHLTLNTDHTGFTVKVLPITNNYSMSYESPSFVVRKSGDIGIGAKTLNNLFPGTNSTYQSIWNAILVAIGYPLIYYINPRISTINYLQQTLGQYSMVHYNDTINHVDNDNTDSVLTDDLSFDIVTVPQDQSVGDAPWSTLFYALGASAVNALEYNIEKVVVNTHQNQSAISDTGKKFSQMFLKNLESMASTEFMVQSLTPTIKSEVTALKTLDMFYSTSNSQHIKAGPGFVQHDFVQQCIAQSVTSVQLESQQLSMTYIIKALTLYQIQFEQYVTEQIAELIKSQADYQGGTPFTVVGVSSGTSYGWITSLLLSTVYSTLKTISAAMDVALKNIDPLLDSLGAKELRTTVTAKQSKHVYDIEAKHRYGSKHETFMWPCFGCTGKEYRDESVVATTISKPWHISISPFADGQLRTGIGESLVDDKPSTATISSSSGIKDECVGDIDYRIAACYGQSSIKQLPDDMAIVCGVDSFMPATPFKNENISESEPSFTPPIIQDYVISKEFELFMSCIDGEVLWVGCKDTKLIDGEPSNIVYNNGFCGVASSYTVIEIKNGMQREYIRPWAVTPEVLALNQTGINVAFDEECCHGFDGVGYRITDWYGAAGMNKEFMTMQYAFQPNDRLKRSNKLPANNFLGNFMFDPAMCVDTHDSVCSIVTVPAKNEGLESGVVGEDKDDLRYALPIFSEFVSTLPAVVKTAQPYKLAIFDGITSLTTDIRNTQTAYKTPVSDDFIIGEQLYRATHEYICKVTEQDGAVVVTPLVPNLGMTYLGASPFEAWFYSQATRQYYSYTGGSSIKLVDMLERFRDIKSGCWDFINQEVVFPCLATMKRLDKYIDDDADETDNIVIPTIRGNMVRGDITPPDITIFNTESWFRTLSLSSGLVYQGPNRCVINRFAYCDYMLSDIKANKRKWTKVPREIYHPVRKYPENYKDVTDYINDGVKGWTHNPFLLVTAPLGINEETDCLFEWEITFAWTIEMDRIVESNEYITVNVMSETMTPGGKVFSRPTHIYLTKDLFTRTGNYGYYSFRYNSNNGIGNRERLHIWSDGYIAVSSLQIEYKPITVKRNTILTQQVDIQGKQEM